MQKLTNNEHHFFTRRDFINRLGNGFGGLSLSALLQEEAQSAINPLIPKKPHFPAKAKSVIHLFMNGGPSQVDTFDPKPALTKYDGKKLPIDYLKTERPTGAALKSPFSFKKYGQSGLEISELFPNVARSADDLCIIRSMHADVPNHEPSLLLMNCGEPRLIRPSVGSWVSYGLGTENQNLPAFVVMSDPLNRGLPKGHAANWGSGFLPGAFQGTWVRSKGEPIPNLKRIAGLSDQQQRAQLDFLGKLNAAHEKRYPAETELTARIKSFELAYRMQQEAPECFEIDNEPEHIKSLYGIGEKRCAHFARQCLMARRMVERGVRFVQIYSGGMENARSWDGHGDIKKNHTQFAGETDQPIAGLLADLEQRGMLDETLVIWGGEFGRLPVSQLSGGKPTGRDHNPHAGCYWFAGGGARGGTSYGETDEVGHKAAVDTVEIHDIHATILHLLGMDHKRLTYLHSGRRFRLTDVAGNVIHDVVA